MTEKLHVQYLDVLKGIVIFLVVVGHAFHFGFAYYRSPLLEVLKSIDMPIFLFLSGFLGATSIKFDGESFRKYWVKKFRQLLLPLTTLPFLYAYVYNISWSHLLFDRMHGGYWFTLTLFEMFILLYLVRWINSLVNKEDSPFIEVVIAVISLAVVLLIDSPWERLHKLSWEALSWGKMNYLYHYFLIGYFVGKYKSIEAVITAPIIHALSGIVFFFCIYEAMTDRRILEGIPASLSGLIFMYASIKQIGNSSTLSNRCLSYLGKESRTIYLTHYFFLFSAPMVGTWLLSLKGTSRIFLWEVMSASIYALVVVAITLIMVKLIRSSSVLDTLFYGKRFDRWY